jgi:hypothetical protein
MHENYAFTRNTTEEFARRVRKNLHFITRKRSEGEDVHEVTQLVTSLLGLIVFPWEDGALSELESLSLSNLEQQGWPHWDIILDEKGDTNTLGKLIWHLRNAASHRRLTFSSDDPEMSKVEIQFEDAPQQNAPPNWRAKINSGDLKVFCDRFTARLEDLVG